MDDFDMVSYLMGQKAAGGGSSEKPWNFVKNITTLSDSLSELSGYSEVLMILRDTTSGLSMDSAVYPISYIDAGNDCRIIYASGTDVYWGRVRIESDNYAGGVNTANSSMAVYAR